jgi:hypothetical protein
MLRLGRRRVDHANSVGLPQSPLHDGATMLTQQRAARRVVLWLAVYATAFGGGAAGLLLIANSYDKKTGRGLFEWERIFLDLFAASLIAAVLVLVVRAVAALKQGPVAGFILPDATGKPGLYQVELAGGGCTHRVVRLIPMPRRSTIPPDGVAALVWESRGGRSVAAATERTVYLPYVWTGFGGWRKDSD